MSACSKGTGRHHGAVAAEPVPLAGSSAMTAHSWDMEEGEDEAASGSSTDEPSEDEDVLMTQPTLSGSSEPATTDPTNDDEQEAAFEVGSDGYYDLCHACSDGGELVCCERRPRVLHLACVPCLECRLESGVPHLCRRS